MALDYEESKQKIVEALQKKQKTKSKFYFNDLAKILEAKPREAKKVINFPFGNTSNFAIISGTHPQRRYCRHRGQPRAL